MSEARRVNLTTLNSMASTVNLPSLGQTSNTAPSVNSVRFGNDLFGEPEGVHSATEEQPSTVRLCLELSPTDKVTYPEINYARLIRLEEKKQKKLKQKLNIASSSSAPFEDNDNDVARIAAELEKKYGCAYGRGRGRSKRDDHCDIGMGYDESDSFIDNTDAYDENIPEEVETVEGGFYINCGALEFKQLNTETVKLKTDEIIKMPNKSRKRILSLSTSSDDSSSSENEENTISNEKHDHNDSESSESTSKSKNIATTAAKRPKKDSISAIIKKPVQQNGKKKDKISNSSVRLSISSSNSPKQATGLDEAASDDDKDKGAIRQKTIKTTTVKDMLKAKRDSFLKMQVGGGDAGKSVNGELRGAASKSSDDDSSESSDDDESRSHSDSNHSTPASQDKTKSDEKMETISNPLESTEKLRTSDTKLPELEVEIIANVQSFKELVKSKNNIGKRFLFDEELADTFLRIDETLLCIEKSHRNMVFAHLEYHLQLPKYFLLRKAKQLRVKIEKSKTERALLKLRKAVFEAMNGVIANYESEVRKHAEIQETNSNNGNSIKMPKKKFPWNSNIRNLLYDVYQTRWTSYPVLCTRKGSLEDFITVFLKEKVVELWPNGWMRFEELQKEIEKHKQANRKSKEKKADNSSNMVQSVSTSSTSTSNILTTSTTAALSSYAKQFEDFASSRSCCNSDNDSNTSNGSNLKRKINTEDPSNIIKYKSGKSNANITTVCSNGSLATNCGEEVTFTNINVDTNIGTVVRHNTSSLPTDTTPAQTASTPTVSAVTGVVSSNSHFQDNLLHSNVVTLTKPTAHVIDLDRYSSASDILEKSKQLQKALVNAPSSALDCQTNIATAPALERTNSSDSDGVEIVGIFQANTNSSLESKARPKKNQLQQSSSIKSPGIYNNNNNKKLSPSGLSSAFDVNTALSALKDLERSQHTKPKNTSVNAREPLQ